MHGIIFQQLNKFIRENHGFKTLKEIAKDAGMANKFHDATKSHPDSELEDLINSAIKILNVDREVLLESFGKYIAPGLLKTYHAYVKQEWDALDLIEHVEKTMHKVVRASTPEASPPKLIITRTGANSLSLEYTSPRQMISLGIGIIDAISEHYNEKLTIEKQDIPNGTKLTIERQ